ncbi:MFS transporter [Acaricomes phytoseiuli]|uniref:MFS transporter n=1 Tax=Acaricomes phytoseiuli TaxID=291968 RepID=UPI00035E9087|nr:MFS transporter [Acaricomes phytoseiuli]MCW1250234.1 MFS transporter [Acaricomes phytoseiuli]
MSHLTPAPVDASPVIEASRHGRFGHLIRLSGRGFIPLGLFARLPLAMLTVGVLTLVTSVSGSYAIGGFAAGAVGAGSAIGAPLLGFLADRVGQRPVLIIAAILNTAILLGLLIFCAAATNNSDTGSGAAWPADATGWVLLLALAAGATSPQVGPLARVRWMALSRNVPDRERGRVLDTALSYESTADELTFVLGPALVGLLAALIAPWLPLLLAAAITAVLVTLFAIHPTVTAVPVHRRGTTLADEDAALGAGKVPWLRVGIPVLAMVCMGTFFGGTQTSLSAFAGEVAPEAGGSELAGLLYAVMGLSSAAAALSVAFWPQGFAPRWRWIASAAPMAALAGLLSGPADLTSMLVLLFFLGMPVGPTMVTIFTIGGQAAPRRWLGTVMTALASGIVAGTAIGAAMAGAFAQSSGYHAAFAVPFAAACALLLLGLLSLRFNRPS